MFIIAQILFLLHKYLYYCPKILFIAQIFFYCPNILLLPIFFFFQKVIKAMGFDWHEDHFVCTVCKKTLAGESFFEKNGQPYCRADYEERFADKCALCLKPITDKAIIALNEKWHQACFKCNVRFTITITLTLYPFQVDYVMSRPTIIYFIAQIYLTAQKKIFTAEIFFLLPKKVFYRPNIFLHLKNLLTSVRL